MVFKKLFVSMVLGVAILCSSPSAFAEDYWIDGHDGYNSYIVTEESELIDEKSARARMKDVSPSGKVILCDLYMWEIKGDLFCSTLKEHFGTLRGNRILDHNAPAAKIYDFMLKNYEPKHRTMPI